MPRHFGNAPSPFAGKRILLVGDSHTVGAYGDALAAAFRAAGAASVTRVSHVGAAAGDYLTGKYAAEFRAAARQGADVLVLTLGTNDAAASDYVKPKTTVARLQSIVSAVGAPVSFYVGPPAFHPDSARLYNPAFAAKDLNERAAALWAAAEGNVGTYAIDPRGVTRVAAQRKGPNSAMPKGDIHLDAAGGKEWASFVFDQASDLMASAPTVHSTRVAPQPQQGMALGVLAALAIVLLVRLGLMARDTGAAAVAGWRKRRRRR